MQLISALVMPPNSVAPAGTGLRTLKFDSAFSVLVAIAWCLKSLLSFLV